MDNQIVLSMQDICKEFPGVKALDGVGFELRKGEVHAICGENGAGKSTLLKILNGIYKRDSGKVVLNGKEVHFKNIQDARHHGVSVIPQEIQVAPHMTVAENIFMGKLPMKFFGLVDWKKVQEDTKNIQKRLGSTAVNMGVKTKVASLSMGHKQLIEILRALSFKTEILALDEPTSSLSDEETAQLFKLIRELTAQGISIIYVSHRLKEIFEICDRVTVLKDGKYAGTRSIKEIDSSEIVKMMVGRDLNLFGELECNLIDRNTELLAVKNLTRDGVFRDISFSVRKGEILGFFGIVGSGRTEVARAIFGVDKKTSGQVFINGKAVDIKSPAKAVENKMGFVTEDRHGEGLVLTASVKWNLTLPFIKRLSKLSFLKHRLERTTAKELMKTLNVKAPNEETIIKGLSGGNQQKVVIAKWVAAGSDVLIFDEPTRGIDVGAKAEVYRLMKSLAKEGKAIIMISSELPEILGLSHRILVFRDGEIKAEFDNCAELTEEDIIKKAIVH